MRDYPSFYFPFLLSFIQSPPLLNVDILFTIVVIAKLNKNRLGAKKLNKVMPRA